jgi:hypothetical protein
MISDSTTDCSFKNRTDSTRKLPQLLDDDLSFNKVTYDVSKELTDKVSMKNKSLTVFHIYLLCDTISEEDISTPFLHISCY